jgi:hypothetical protein
MGGREGGWKFCGAEKEPHVQQLGKTVEIPSQSGIMELHKIFQPAAVA